MPRPLWSGSITFGLVAVPVKLYGATEKKDVRFHELEKGTGRRIRHRRIAEGTGQEVEREELVKGYEIADGKYVAVTPKELESLQPAKSKAIEIEDFVDLDEIDPIYYEKTYYIVPDTNKGASKPYALLREAMQKSNKVGIGQFVMRSREYLAAVRPQNGRLVLETMFYPDEIRQVPEVDLPRTRVGERELKMATQLVDSLASEWEPSRYQDTYRERVLDLIRKKAEGEEVVVEHPEEPQVPTDLMEALRASHEAIAGRRGSPRKTKRGRTTARKKAARPRRRSA